ncbi:MAG: hypothetical protein EZS28_007088 [Streblomastix strix]|uniref:Uncharacterized protein n=1 Tax=Streblomastix strix TaxID=222440 RepID=A0A5J4WRH1_9EUKA|nr:MAG: hypothetical protein EZS28_007088 [Streblomastix strix]
MSRSAPESSSIYTWSELHKYGSKNKSNKFSLNIGENKKRVVTNKTVPWKNRIYGTRREVLDVQVKI